MAETTAAGRPHTNTPVGHLSVHVEESRPGDTPFLFEWQPKRTGSALVVSFATHIAFFFLMMGLVRIGAQMGSTEEIPREPLNAQIVWLPEEGPGGGGGGGGNQMKEPPRVAELPGKDKLTVPVEKPPELEAPEPKDEEPPQVAQLNIPAATLAAGIEAMPGVIAEVPSLPSLSQGSGSGGGAGTGRGTGVGPGTGSGLGPGEGGGVGGGAYRPGNGVSPPILTSQVKPQYTADAMRAKIQGTVLLECVVQRDGSVTNVQIVRSLDPTFGLDQEAIKAARQWRFRPGRLMGEAVPVLVTIELTFTLR
jgi:TonB family protein